MMRTLFLYPISIIIYIIIFLRNKFYDFNLLPIQKSKIPVISIGNIQMGGTGKTPFVIALTQKLLEDNIKPLIITRGYKRKTTNQIIFNDIEKYTAMEVGDEPYYMKQVLKTVPIIIDHNKKEAIKVAENMSDIDCIILDDGYQSRYIQRDVEIVLINTELPNKSFSIVPLGCLREPIFNLHRAEFIYTTKGPEIHSLLKNYNTKYIQSNFQIVKYNKNGVIEKQSEIYKSKTQRLVAFSGIANPEHFFKILNKLGVVVDEKIIFNNHHTYKLDGSDLKQSDNIIYITTYKDYVKLKELKIEIYILEMNFILNDSKLLKTIREKINEN